MSETSHGAVPARGRDPKRRVLLSAWLISFVLHSVLMAASARWVVGVERASVDEEEYFSFQIRPRSGDPTGDVDGAVRVVESVDAIVEQVDTNPPEPQIAPAPAADARIVAPPPETLPEETPEVRLPEPTAEALETPAEPAASELASDAVPAVASTSTGSASEMGSSASAGVRAQERLGSRNGSLEGVSSADVAGGESGPLLLDAPRPVYPAASIRHGEEGSVLCALHIDTTGRVSAVEVLQSSGHRPLDDAARAALLRWRFEPAQKQGRVVPARIQHRVHFRLE